MMARDYMLVHPMLIGWLIVPYTMINKLSFGEPVFVGSFEDCLSELNKIKNDREN